MAKPTEQEYRDAVENKAIFLDWLRRENKRRDELLDELLDVRSTIRLYVEQIEKMNEIIQIYEIYKEIENERNGW